MDNKQDFTQGHILEKLLMFMVPILGALVLQAMYGAVDLLIVGWFGSSEGISAVSTGSNIVNLVVFTIGGLTMGITIVMSQYLGENKPKKISQVLGGVIAFFFVLSIIIAILLLIFAPMLCTLMQAPKEALDLTILYVRICGGGILFVIAYNVISAIFRGLGNSTLPLVFVGIAALCNVVLDYIFVAIFNMDVAGAALATILAQAISVILSIVIIRKVNLPFEFQLSDIGFNEEVKHFLRLGAPIAFQEMLTNISFLALCAFVNRLGLDASSGYGVAQKIVSFVMLVPGSLMQSMSSFVAQNVGAGKERRAKQAMFTGMSIGAVIGIVIFTLTLLKGDFLSSIFTSNPNYIQQSFDYLKGFAIEAVVTSFLFSYMGYFNGHGLTLFVMGQGLAQSFIVRLPMSYIMSIQPNASLTQIGFAAPSATIFGIILCTIYYFMIKNKYMDRIIEETAHE